MSYSYTFDGNNCLDGANAPQSLCYSDCQSPLPARTIVSDADDDDVSIVGDILTHVNNYNETKSGNSSSNTFTTFNSSSAFNWSTGFDEQYQVITPSCQDSQEIADRTTIAKVGAKNGTRSDIPFCPPLFHVTDERKTPLTIQPRDQRAEKFHPELVDEYTFNSNQFDESSTRHDFNTYYRKLGDTLSEKKRGICENRNTASDLVLNESHLNESRNGSHKIPKPVARESHQSITNHATSNNERSTVPQHRSEPHNFQREQNQINLTDTEDHRKSSTTTMPTKANACLPRQRSRAIAIKRSRPGDHFIDTSPSFASPSDKEERRCDAELYDYATWRMYNRIIDHRRKHLLRMQLQDEYRREEQQNVHVLQNEISSTANHVCTSHNMDVHTSGRNIHASTASASQHNILHHDISYVNDDPFSDSEDDDQIFDLEL